MALIKITDAKQLKNGNKYFLTNQIETVATHFLEVRPGEGNWTNEMPSAQFTNTSFYKYDRFKLFDDLKKDKIQIYEVKQ